MTLKIEVVGGLLVTPPLCCSLCKDFTCIGQSVADGVLTRAEPAPKVRNMKARGKRVAEAERVAPGQGGSNWGALKVRNILPKPSYYALSELRNGARVDQGRRAPLPLRACPWLSYSAPLALFGSLIRLLRQSRIY